MNEDQDGGGGRTTTDTGTDDITTAPLEPAGDVTTGGRRPSPKAATAVSARRAAADRQAPGPEAPGTARVRGLAEDVDRLGELVRRLTATAAALDGRLDEEVRGVLDSAEEALAEAAAARRATAEAEELMREAEARAEAAREETAAAQEELRKGLAAAKSTVAAAQASEANAWKEAGAAQQVRATAANEAAHADGLRKRAEAAWGTEHQARVEAERERDDLATRLAAEQVALAAVHAELKDGRAEAEDARIRAEGAAESERRLRAELTTSQAETARLVIERDAATARAEEQAARADRAERLADETAARAAEAEARAERAERRADATGARADRDAAAAHALQDTLRSALDLPSVEDVGDGHGVPVGESGAVMARPGGLIGIERVPDVLDGETAARFARAILAVRVHQVTRRPQEDTGTADDAEAAEAAGPED
ncbi:hypothetical protein AGRA3207_000884 [Actinomadura graeca]|uniref:TolA protein n=1 Tax=Actinomadura graeca TaxID=2750812 RepID=A0ABX8QN64_9ACTN|nr:hypothetical protein [Actinomadura graeca]QXJ20211.1 hypothetical protein AGRA3207_000884 [Actinomadura graeca]